MVLQRPLDLNLVTRLDSVKPRLKKKLFPLTIDELVLLPFQKNLPFDLYDKNKRVKPRSQQLLSDLIQAKKAEILSFRDTAYHIILREALGVKINSQLERIDDIANEKTLLKYLVDPHHVGKKEEAILKSQTTPRHQPTPALPCAQGVSWSSVYKCFKDTQAHFKGEKNVPHIESLERFPVKLALDILQGATNNHQKWLYGIRKEKMPASMGKKYALKMAEKMNELGSDRFHKHELLDCNVNDFAGIWLISSEKIDVDKPRQFQASALNKLITYLYKESVFDVEKFHNFYEKDSNYAQAIHLYLKPSYFSLKDFGVANTFTPYSDLLPELGTDHLKVSVHLQGIYGAMANKLFGKGSHLHYKLRQEGKEKDFVTKLSDAHQLAFYRNKEFFSDLLSH